VYVQPAETNNIKERKIASDTTKHKTNLSEKELISKTVHFGFNKSFLSYNNKLILYSVYKELNVNKNPIITIRAYTDSLGCDEFNMKLSLKRALAIKRYFINKGLDKKLIISEGFGKTNPVSSNKNPKGRTENRRGELSVTVQNSFVPDSKPAIIEKTQLIDKDVKKKIVTGNDVNQKLEPNIHKEPVDSKVKEINQSVVKDSPVKLDSLKMLNEKSPVAPQKSGPNKLKAEKDTSKKIVDPL
jgi:outer membrane protein OmpA-like peptidoglycan-associated protein